MKKSVLLRSCAFFSLSLTATAVAPTAAAALTAFIVSLLIGPWLIRQLRAATNAEYRSYVHWGATSQDIMDTADVLQGLTSGQSAGGFSFPFLEDPSQIFGSLSANGRVFLVNPSGILFGPGAQVSVGALVASTLSITDDDFSGPSRVRLGRLLLL